MKCEIIQDLIPLYAENLCSEESKIIVKEHIDTCNDCKRYLENIEKSIAPPIPSEQKIKEIISEKDLLSRSKQSIQKDILKKILIVFNVISILITVFAIIVSATIMFKEYSIKYPMLHYTRNINLLYLICFLVGLSPVIIAILELCSIKRSKIQHFTRKFISNILIQSVAVFLSLVIAITIFLIVPPLESQTDNLDEYLKVDKSILKYETIYNKFFPANIPENASDLEYHYKKYSNIVNTNVQIQFSMKLPESQYLTERDRVLGNNVIPIKGEKNTFDVTLYEVRYPGKVKLEFSYDDVIKRLTYYMHLDDN
ncbi:MAG: zf-HC2 domain-containing protein [Lacrimispora sp.]